VHGARRQPRRELGGVEALESVGLEGAELLRRETCPTDRRGAFAVLTEEGKATLRRTWPAYAQGIAAYFTRYLSADEAEFLTSVLGRVAKRDGGSP